MLSRNSDNARKGDNLGSGPDALLEVLGFLGAVADLLVHDDNCLGWGYCSMDSPLCDSPWNGQWSELLEDAVRLYLSGDDITEAVR